MIEDDVNTNKQFRVYDDTSHYVRLSVDEAIARNLNTWQGWKCSAGVRALYIDYDGNLWICNTASSKLDRFNKADWSKLIKTNNIKINQNGWWPDKEKVLAEFNKNKNAFKKILPFNADIKALNPGFLGNIYEGYDLPNEWFICQWQSCGCGADVILSKAKTDDYKEILAVSKRSWQGKEETLKDIVKNINDPVAVEMNFPIPYQVLWDIGRRCNYDCSYCWTSVHNRTDDHKDFDLMVKTADRIIDEWAHHEMIRWNFGGGEPTLHPQFLDFLEHLNDRKQWTMVTTNGTRDYKYWTKAIKYLNSVNMSAHFDGLLSDKEEDRFIHNLEVICEHFDSHNDDHWLEIKIMAPPQHLDRAIKMHSKIKALGIMDKHGANDRIKGSLSMVPIRSLGDSGTLVKYTDEQLEIFKNQ